MKFNFYALLMLSLATYGIINAIKYTGAEKIAHRNGQNYWNTSKDEQGLDKYCQNLYPGNAEAIKACNMAAHSTE